MPLSQKKRLDPSTVNKQIRLNILSDPANLAQAREAVEMLCIANQFDTTAVGEIGLCVNEAMANVIRHAYDGAIDRPIDLSASIENDAIEIKIRDWGNGVNPLDEPVRPHDPTKPGGLGLICLQKMMGKAEFVPQPDGMLLIMSRSRNGRNRV